MTKRPRHDQYAPVPEGGLTRVKKKWIEKWTKYLLYLLTLPREFPKI